jgi:hypothetical protein
MFGGSVDTDGYMQGNFTDMPWIVEVGRCRLTVSTPVLKVRLVSTLDTII